MWVNLRKRVHNGRHRGLVSRAHVVKIQHALHSTCLHSPDDGLGVFAEQCGCFGWLEKKQKQAKIKIKTGLRETKPVFEQMGQGKLGKLQHW